MPSLKNDAQLKKKKSLKFIKKEKMKNHDQKKKKKS